MLEYINLLKLKNPDCFAGGLNADRIEMGNMLMKKTYQISDENKNLAKYEMKAPDYELVDRECTSLANLSFQPARYEFSNGTWVSKAPKKDQVSIMITGDIACFGKQFTEASRRGGYDFNYEFDVVKTIFSKADLVIGNLETMVFPNAPYRDVRLVSEQHYYCNAPVEFLDAVRQAGFDLVTNANNHDLDTGAIGIGETIDNIERFGLIHTGTFKSDKKRFEVLDVCGFKIAIVAFATDHNDLMENLTAEGADFLLNNYSKEKAAWLAAEARANGAKLVFACIHWGQEHKLVQNSAQESMAEELAIAGYDCIFGSHPHVLQPYVMNNIIHISIYSCVITF